MSEGNTSGPEHQAKTAVTRRDFLKGTIEKAFKAVVAVAVVSNIPGIRGTVGAVSVDSYQGDSPELTKELIAQKRVEAENKAEDQKLIKSLAGAFAKGWVCKLNGPCEGNQLANKDPFFWMDKATLILDAIKAASGADYSVSAGQPLKISKDGRELSEDEIKIVLEENDKDSKDDFNNSVSGYFGLSEFNALNNTKLTRLNLASVIAVAITETGGEKDKGVLYGRSIIADRLKILALRGFQSSLPDMVEEELKHQSIDGKPVLTSGDEARYDVDDFIITARVLGGLHVNKGRRGHIDVLSKDGRSLNKELFYPYYNANPIWYARANGIYQALDRAVLLNPKLEFIFKNLIK